MYFLTRIKVKSIPKSMPGTMDLSYTHEGKKVLKIDAELDSTNVNIKKGILGKINFKRLSKFNVAMVYGGIIRKETFPNSNSKGFDNCY